MIEVKTVETRKQQKEFLEFPNRLYRNNPCYVPPLYMDEKKIFRADYMYYDQSEAVYFNAYKDGKIAGRISGILQRASNEKRSEKRIRFTRFDAIDDLEVSKALFEAVENWGREKGMEYICGPLGFSDLEREGLLVDGFDKVSTFEEQYNAPYYMKHLEALGYEKEVDWVESEIRVAKDYDGSLNKISDYIMKRYRLHWGEASSVSEFIERYSDAFFDLLDKSYGDLYGTVPFTEGMKKMLIDNFRLIVKLKYVGVILDENDQVICLAVCFPSMAKALYKTGGHLRAKALSRLLKALNHPQVLDFGLIGVEPSYENRGVSACVAAKLCDLLQKEGIEHCETNLNLEYNSAIRNFWKRFDSVEHKRRRSYLKKL